ncbi:GPR1/FUN34/YaaH family transporter [Streptomyces sp. NPDC052079]|uniref:GPR1/FUN34/YaaH family transporter n=1 Tax=Streptomyces sp. NPDC052079 TaxID=3155526 RepID=UPI003433B0BA
MNETAGHDCGDDVLAGHLPKAPARIAGGLTSRVEGVLDADCSHFRRFDPALVSARKAGGAVASSASTNNRPNQDRRPVDSTGNHSQLTEEHMMAAAAEAPARSTPAGDPALIGVPTFVVGAVALGLVLTGYVPAGAVGASIAIILPATGLGQLVAAVWAAALGQNAAAAVFGVFSGFWLSYAALVLGLIHGWFGVSGDAAVATQGLFLISWLVTIVLLTLATLRLPAAFTLLFTLIDIALALVLYGTVSASAAATTAGGYVVFAFTAVGVYMFAGALFAATGGRPLPLGRPVLS